MRINRFSIKFIVDGILLFFFFLLNWFDRVTVWKWIKFYSWENERAFALWFNFLDIFFTFFSCAFIHDGIDTTRSLFLDDFLVRLTRRSLNSSYFIAISFSSQHHFHRNRYIIARRPAKKTRWRNKQKLLFDDTILLFPGFCLIVVFDTIRTRFCWIGDARRVNLSNFFGCISNWILNWMLK